MNVGLYFGSFNPVHIGHIVIAQYFREFSDFEEVWFVVSPQNPFKSKDSLASEYERLHMVELGIDHIDGLRSCNIEFGLKKPSYTIDTLVALRQKYPEHEFGLIMGSDNLKNFHKWKNHQNILEKHPLKIYPRPGYDYHEKAKEYAAQIIDAPLMEISSTLIRRALKEKKNISAMLPPKVWEYLEGSSVYS